MSKMVFRVWIVGVVLLLAEPIVHAQTSTGSVSGEVTDVSGAVIQNAEVTLTDPATHLTQATKTNAKGVFEFPQVQAGAYELTIVHEGFSTSQAQLTVEVEQVRRLDTRMIAGAKETVIDVHADAVSIETGTSSLGTVISEKEVQDLPLDGRNVFALAGLSPGVLPGGSFGVGLSTSREAAIAAGANNFRVSGGVAGFNEILLDGIPITVCCQGQPALIPNPDIVQEFKVQTSVPAANFGRSSGGALNFTTKSGKARVFGDVYEYMRNTILDANNYFAKQSGYPRPGLVFNQFGGTLGGPLWIPHVLSKQKTFFFFGFEGVQSAKKNFTITTVPSLLQRKGDLSEEPGITYDPLNYTATFTPDGVQVNNRNILYNDAGVCCGVPVSRQDPIALKLLNLFPLPNRASAPSYVNNYQFEAPQYDSDWQYNARIDRTINSRYNFFFRGTYGTNLDLQSGILGTYNDLGATHQTLQSAVFEWDNTVILTPSILLNAHYGFAWQKNIQHSGGLNASATTYGLPASFAAMQPTPGVPTQSISGYGSPVSDNATDMRHYTHSFGASVTSQRGHHTLLAGWDGRIFVNNVYPNSNGAGGFSYTGIFTVGPTSASKPAPTGQTQFDAIAEFLLGLPDQGSVQNTTRFSYQQPYNAFYLQDDWRILPRLTLNLGIRYDLENGPIEKNGKMSYFDPNAANPLSPIIHTAFQGNVAFGGVNGYSRRNWEMPLNEVGPRIGAAYALGNNAVLRGAYGILYLPTTQRLSNAGNPAYNISTNYLASTTNGSTTASSIDNPYPNGVQAPYGPGEHLYPQVGGSVTSPLFNEVSGYVQQYNFNTQLQMAPAVVMTVGYAGSHGVHLPQTLSPNNLNPKYFGAPGDTTTVDKIYYTTLKNPFYNPATSTSYAVPGYLASTGVSELQLLSAYPQYEGMALQFVPEGSSSYNSLLASVRIRTKLVTSIIGYTWSKSLGNINNNITSALDTGAPAYQNSYDLAIEKAVDPADATHRFTASVIGKLPIGRGQLFFSRMPRWADAVVGGWQLSTIETLQTGLPLSLSTSGQPEGAGTRPNYVPGVAPLTPGPAKSRLGNGEQTYLNPAAFAYPLAFQFGNVRRTADGLRAPGIFNTDMSAVKTITLHGTWRLQFRGEAFNLFNRVQFNRPGSIYGLDTFGTITSTANLPRQIQVAGKLFW